MLLPISPRWLAALALWVLPYMANADPGESFIALDEAAAANERTVGVVVERDDRWFDLLDDVGASLQLAAGVRVVPIVGSTHVQNLFDLLYLDGVDIAIVRRDTIDYVRRVAGLAAVARLAEPVATIGEQRLVIIADPSVRELSDLSGRPVGIGRPGSGEFVTGTLLFDTLGIDIVPREVGGDEAIERVARDQLAASVHLLDRGAADGRPLTVDAALAADLHVLSVPPSTRLDERYRRIVLDERDVARVIGPDERVSSLAVDLLLVAYAWRRENARTERVARFVDAFVDRHDALQGANGESEWNGIDLALRPGEAGPSPLLSRALDRRAARMQRLEATTADYDDRAEAETTRLLLARDREPETDSAPTLSQQTVTPWYDGGARLPTLDELFGTSDWMSSAPGKP